MEFSSCDPWFELLWNHLLPQFCKKSIGSVNFDNRHGLCGQSLMMEFSFRELVTEFVSCFTWGFGFKEAICHCVGVTQVFKQIFQNSMGKHWHKDFLFVNSHSTKSIANFWQSCFLTSRQMDRQLFFQENGKTCVWNWSLIMVGRVSMKCVSWWGLVGWNLHPKMGSVEPSYAEQNGSFLARWKNWKGHLRTENKEDNKKAWDSNTKLFSHQWHMFMCLLYAM